MSNQKLSLKSSDTKAVLSQLKKANASLVKTNPGDSLNRQAVHTVYGGAHLFKAEVPQKLGALALKSLESYAPHASAFAEAIGLSGGELAEKVFERVVEKLKREPVEDFRIDFEDGYGYRPDAEEDAHAVSSALELAKAIDTGNLPPFIGIRIKPFSGDLTDRSVRTLDLFLTTLRQAGQGKLPKNFVITLPKVTIPAHVAALDQVLTLLEKKLRWPKGTFKIEFMVETPQVIISAQGIAPMTAIIKAGNGRCVSAHFGTYDYTALCNITAAYQSITHSACDFAKDVLQVSLAQTGINISDGATTVMPVVLHRFVPGGSALTVQQEEENRNAVYRAWRLHFENIRHGLKAGFYQGWDLHPAQLPIRYAAIYSFFLEGLQDASLRLKTFVDRAAQATLVGRVFDDAATGQGLLNFFLRGLNCGAITWEETQVTGLTREELQTRSFVKILDGRKDRQQKQSPVPA